MEVLEVGENAGIHIEPQVYTGSNNKRRRGNNQTDRQRIVDAVFGKNNAEITRVAGTGDCFWSSLERALVSEPKLGKESGPENRYAASTLKLARWKHWIKLYYCLLHGVPMNEVKATDVLHKHAENILGLSNQILSMEFDITHEKVEIQQELIRAAFVVQYGENIFPSESYPNTLTSMSNNINWFFGASKGDDLYVETQWLCYVANLLKAPIWLLGVQNKQYKDLLLAYDPYEDKYANLVNAIFERFTTPYMDAAKDKYPLGEPIVLVYSGSHYDVVTNYHTIPTFSDIRSKDYDAKYVDGNCIWLGKPPEGSGRNPISLREEGSKDDPITI